MPETQKNIGQIHQGLNGLIKGSVATDIFSRVAFSTDAGIYQITPVCVVTPRDAEDVSAIVKYAAQQNIPIAARGAGSGFAGESLTDGIVIDTARYMNRIIGTEDNGRTVVCEPGVVLDDLNNYLAQFGRKIGPDPSSSNRAVISGVVANNATGAHSLEYGYIAEHILSIEIVLYDGSIVELKNAFDFSKAKSCLAEIGKKCAKLLTEKDQIINQAMPRTKRNHCGYNIVGICHDNKLDMAKMMAGSESTLGIFTKITLRSVDNPAAKGIVHFEFDSFEKMALAVPVIVGSGACACELMDKTLINIARQALPKYRDILPEDCHASLLVEHTGQGLDEVRAKLEKTDLAVGELASKRKQVLDLETQSRLWKMRKDAVPLLHRAKGQAHPIAFIEDVSVENTQLAEYLGALEDISVRHNIQIAFYGHAGDGQLHIRPYLDLSEPADITKMQQIANDVFELAWSLGGSISGEHADGLLRAAFIRKQYGDELYQVFKEIKNIFDPNGILNPGKIINDDPDVMIKNLRASLPVLNNRLKTNLFFRGDEFRSQIEQCSGDGVCLSTQLGSRMCPVYRATGDELSCSRAKANLLRAWITGTLSENDFESKDFKDILNRCINCKMCSVECPSCVDISKLIIEARAEYTRRLGLSPTEILLSHNRYLSMAACTFWPISNFIMQLGISRTLLEKIFDLDRRRAFPRFERGSFLSKARKYLAKAGPIENPIEKVAYFVDSYVNYNDHELGFAVIKFLRYNDIEVILPKQRPAPLPAISYGNLKTARKDLVYNVREFSAAAMEGYKIVCSEPSAALCLRDDLRLLIDNTAARLVSAGTFELMYYIKTLADEGKLKADIIHEANRVDNFGYHCPCHLKAMGVAGKTIPLLKKLA